MEALHIPERSAGTKLLAVFGVGLLLGGPLLLVGALQWEREARAREVLQEIASRAGGTQTVSGPMLAVPFTHPLVERTVDASGRTVETTRRQRGRVLVSPDRVQFRVRQTTQTLRRAIYEVPAQTSEVDVEVALSGFESPQLPKGAELEWTKARWLLGISDLRGVGELELAQRTGAETQALEFDAQQSEHDPWANLAAPALLGEAPRELKLRGRFIVSGVEGLHFTPSGRTTDVELSSDWLHPSFDGAHVPNQRTVTPEGFSATWSVSSYARGLPKVSVDPLYLEAQALGVRLVNPADGYAQVGRSLKYAMLFLGLVLATFFVLEVSSGTRVHPAQYGLLGLAQVSFYLLLLALSEHAPIGFAYLIAGAATTTLTGAYALWTFGRARFGTMVFAGTGVSYAFQFALVQLEDHALLLGACLAFAVLAVLMYATRRVRWYRGP